MFDSLEARLGHQFANSQLLKVALTHRSYFFENRASASGHFERMEFLGDSVLDLVLAEALMNRYRDVDEGTLSKWRASLVNENTLGEIARDLDLGKHLFLGKSESRETARPRLLGSALEAVIAAIYQDAGIEAARAFILREFEGRLTTLDASNHFATDFKTRLQEMTQKSARVVPEYQLVSSVGPEHAKVFRYRVLVKERALAEGEGNSRKAAEQEAARAALLVLANETLEGAQA